MSDQISEHDHSEDSGTEASNSPDRSIEEVTKGIKESEITKKQVLDAEKM